MNHVQGTKVVSVVKPQAIVDDASWTATAVDAAGFGTVDFFVQLGAMDIAMAALKLQESDDDSSYSDVTGAIFGTSTNTGGSTSSLPSATDDDKVLSIHVNMQGRKRYLKLVATGGNGTNGTYLSAIALLSNPSVVPVTAAARGLSQELSV